MLTIDRPCPPDRVNSKQARAVFRVVEQAARNAQVHSGAAQVAVDISRSGPDRLRVAVRDDGVGFDPEAASGGLGLRGMRERADVLGVDLQVSSAPGRGAGVVLDLIVGAAPSGYGLSSAEEENPYEV